MADVISDLASKCGISPDLARKGLGAVLGLFKQKLPEESYAKLSAAVPNSDALVEAAENAPEASSGVLGAIGGMAGKLFGGGGAGELLGKLTKLGFSADQIGAFVPKILEFLKGKVPESVLKQVAGLLPQPQEAAH
jgi:hypothetical protein